MPRSRLPMLFAVPILSVSLVIPAAAALARGTVDQHVPTTYADSTYGFAWESPTTGKGDGINKPEAGTTVPVTFSLDTRVKASKLFAPGWPKVRRVDCSTYKPKAGTEWMSRPFGSTGLTRDGTSYTYAWQVRAEWGVGALACRELRIKLTDGTTHSALYRFQKAQTNHAPLAGDDSASIYVGHTDVFVTGNVLSNDSDPDGDPLIVTNAGTFALTGGTFEIAANGDYSYTLTGHDGPLTDQFTYHVSDGHGGSDDGVFQVTVVYGDPV